MRRRRISSPPAEARQRLVREEACAAAQQVRAQGARLDGPAALVRLYGRPSPDSLRRKAARASL